MSDKIIKLSAHRNPVTYTMKITHHWDDSVEVFVYDVADDDRSRNAVGDVIARAAEAYLSRRIGATADDMHEIMLKIINKSMCCTEDCPAIIDVTPQELATWADAVQKYEQARFYMLKGKSHE